MKIHILRREQTVPRPLEEVFSFFACPENLILITPPSLGFEILTPAPIAMHPGAVIDYTVRVLGLRRHWTTVISDYNPPHLFTDVQTKGPYVFWHHAHTFEAADHGTRIIDEVRYVMPWGFLGGLAHKLVVARQLKAIFAYRAAVISRRFGSTPATEQPLGNR